MQLKTAVFVNDSKRDTKEEVHILPTKGEKMQRAG